MAASRAMQSTMRGLALRRQMVSMSRNMVQKRFVQTHSLESEISDLAKQRLVRPTSPHLTIYKAQITWYASAAHRITGAAVSGVLYLFAMAYLVSPYLGWHLESQSLASKVSKVSTPVKSTVKAILAYPFVFHCINGLRHLAWDTGLGFAKKTVIQTGWVGVGLSAVATIYLSFF